MPASATETNGGRSALAASSPLSPLPEWQTVLAHAVRDAGELCRGLQLPPEVAAAARPSARQFPLLVPQTWLARIRGGQRPRSALVAGPPAGRGTGRRAAVPVRSARRGGRRRLLRPALEISGPTLDRSDGRLCPPLPVLLSPPLSVSMSVGGRGQVGSGLPPGGRGTVAGGNHPQRRRPLELAG